MTRAFCLILLSCLLFVTADSADDNFRADQTRVANAIEKILTSKIKLFLYSLDPHDARRFSEKFPENSDESFHHIPVLGRVEIIGTQEKTNLLGAFARGIRENNDMLANCFDPRHGIRIVTKTATNDFVICFECLQVQAYGFGADKYFLTSSSPNIVFNKFLDEHQLKKAE
jgi:hypothetical protein